MQVNKINNSQTFNANYKQKLLKCALKDDSTAYIRITYDEITHDINTLEGYQFCKNGKFSGKGYCKHPKLDKQ